MSQAAPAQRVVVLDRDGTIVIDRDYLDEPDGLEFLPGAAEGLRRLHERGHRLIMITNQSGVARGRFSLGRLRLIHARLLEMVESAGARLEGIYFCPHAPGDGCECRKPEIGLMTRAAAELGFSPSATVVVGDKDTDIEFGRRVGAITVLIGRQAPSGEAAARPDYVAENLMQVARLLETSIR